MAALIALALIAAPVTEVADHVARWRPLIDGASQRFGVPSDWIAHVMTAESGGSTMLGGIPTRSRAGAIGLMQLMPGTWSDMRAAYQLGPNPDDPGDNITAGTAYLRLLYDRFGYPGLFGAYNAGPQRYEDYLAGRSRLPIETRAYLAKLTGSAWSIGTVPSVPVSIFALRHDQDGGKSAPDRAQPASLFVIGETPR